MTLSFTQSSLVSPPRPKGWKLWWHAIRPRTLSLSLAPIIAGLGLANSAGYPFMVGPAVAALLGALAIQMGTNLWNDLADGLRGGDPPDRIGPPRLTALGWASASTVRAAALLCFAGAMLVGAYLVVVGGWPILLLGTLSLVAGWAYSCGPRPIAATPYGEVCVVVFFGVIAVGGTMGVQGAEISPAMVVLGTVIGLPAAAVLMVNNVRDLDPDRRSGRRTLAIVLGGGRARVVYGAMLLAPFPLLLLLPDGALAGLVAMPWALWLAWRFWRHGQGRRCNAFLGATSSFQLGLALLLGCGMALWG